MGNGKNWANVVWFSDCFEHVPEVSRLILSPHIGSRTEEHVDHNEGDDDRVVLADEQIVDGIKVDAYFDILDRTAQYDQLGFFRITTG